MAQTLDMKLYPYWKDDNSNEERDEPLFSWVYFHGKLEEELHHDLVHCDKKPEKPIEGIYDTEINGMACKAFLWVNKDNMQRGLICKSDDKWATQDAFKKYANKEYGI